MNNTPSSSSSSTPSFPKKRFLKIRSKAFILPSLVTVIGLFFGFIATIFAFNEDYKKAAICILFSVIFDACDGRVARRLNVASEFGKELDSLSDLIAFGIAPAVILYTWGFSSMADEFGIIIAFLYLACGALRLARFNVGAPTNVVPKGYFQGLPIPGAAGIIVILCYLYPQPITNINYAIALMVISIIVSLVMISSIPYPSAKNLQLRNINKALLFLAFSLLIAFIYYSPEITLALIFLCYGFSGILLKAYRAVVS